MVDRAFRFDSSFGINSLGIRKKRLFCDHLQVLHTMAFGLGSLYDYADVVSVCDRLLVNRFLVWVAA
jgi:hypothetical protein